MAKNFQLGLLLTLRSNAEKVLKVVSKKGTEVGKSFKEAAVKAQSFGVSIRKAAGDGIRTLTHLSAVSEKFATKAAGLTKWADDISLSMQAFRQVSTLGGSVSAFGGRMVGSLQKPISAMARLENGMVSLKSVMLDANGEVKESFNGLSEAVIKTANKLPATAEEMYQAAAGAIARGMDAEALAKGGLEDSAKFAVGVLGNDYNRALEIAQLVSNAWGVGSDKLAGNFGVYDMLARASSMGVNVEDMTTMIARTGAGAAALGSTGYEALTERMPYLVMLKKQLAGMSADVLSTNLSQLESRVMDKNAVNKAGTAAGVRLQFTDKDGKYLGFGNLVKQLEKLNGLSDVSRSQAIQALFGSSANMNALVSTLITQGTTGAAEAKAEMGGKASLDKRVGNQLGTFSAQWNAFTGTLDTAMGKIGMNFNPALTKLAESATSAADKLSGLAEKYPGITKAVGYTTLGLGGTAIVAGKTLEIAGQLGMAMPLIEKFGPKVLDAGKSAGHAAVKVAKFAAQNWKAAVIIAGFVAWRKVVEDFSDVTTDVGRDLAVLKSGFEGFSAVLGKLGGFFSYIFHGFEVTPEAAAKSLKVDAIAQSDKNLQAEIHKQQIINQGGDHITANFTINNNGKNLNRGELESTVKNVFKDIEMEKTRAGRRKY